MTKNLTPLQADESKDQRNQTKNFLFVFIFQQVRCRTSLKKKKIDIGDFLMDLVTEATMQVDELNSGRWGLH